MKKSHAKINIAQLFFPPSQFLIASTQNSTSSKNKLMKHNKHLELLQKLGKS
jgi:hypothetical protein